MGKTLDFMLSERRNKAAARRFFKRAIGTRILDRMTELGRPNFERTA
jgi:transposase-like protein